MKTRLCEKRICAAISAGIQGATNYRSFRGFRLGDCPRWPVPRLMLQWLCKVTLVMVRYSLDANDAIWHEGDVICVTGIGVYLPE